jgi:tetratricopeptide (TPR) repeat protein
LLFFLQLSTWIFTLFICADLSNRKWKLEQVPLLFLIGGLGVTGIGYLFWMAAGKQFPFMTSTFYESDVFAGYLILLIPTAASFAFSSEDRIRQLLYSMTAFFMMITLFFTSSRGAILIFIFICILWTAFAYQKKPILAKFSLGILLFCISTAFIYLSLFKHKFTLKSIYMKAVNPQSWFTAIGARLSFWIGGIKIFIHHPVLGSGPNTFGRLFPQYQKYFFWYSRFPHNFYIQLLSDQGMINFLLFSSLIMLILIQGFKSLKTETKNYFLLLGLTCGFLAGSLHLFIDVDSNFLSWSVLFWAEGGLILALTARDTDNPTVSKTLKYLLGFILVILILFQGAALSASLLNHQAEKYFSRGKLKTALIKAEKAAKLFPLDSNYFNQESLIEVGLYQKYDKKSWIIKAEKSLNKAIELDPDKPLYLGEMSEIVERLPHGSKKGIILLKKALSLDPLNYPEHYLWLADLEAREKKYKEAKKIYHRILSLYPLSEIHQLPFFRYNNFAMSLAMAHLGLTKLDIQEDKIKKAEKEIRLALKIAPNIPEIHYYAGLLDLYHRNWKKAKFHFEEAIYSPDLSFKAQEWLSFSEFKLKQYHKALNGIKNILKYIKPDSSILVIAGNIYSLQKNRAEAVKLWSKALKLDPKNKYLQGKLKNLTEKEKIMDKKY